MKNSRLSFLFCFLLVSASSIFSQRFDDFDTSDSFDPFANEPEFGSVEEETPVSNYYSTFQTGSLDFSNEKEKILILQSEVAYFDKDQTRQVYAIYNPNKKTVFTGTTTITPTSSDHSQFFAPTPLDFQITMNGKALDYTIKNGHKTLKSTEKITGVYLSGAPVTIQFDFTAPKNANLVIQIKYTNMVSLAPVDSYQLKYTFSKCKNVNPQTFYKIMVNQSNDYIIDEPFYKEYMLINKTDKSNWIFDFDKEYLQNSESYLFNFVKFDSTQKPESYKNFTREQLFFYTEYQIKIMEKELFLKAYINPQETHNLNTIREFNSEIYPVLFAEKIIPEPPKEESAETAIPEQTSTANAQ